MSKVSIALERYLKSGFSSLEVSNSGPVLPLFASDINRAISLLSKFNNAVFIVDSQSNNKNDLITGTVNKFCSNELGISREIFRLDAKQFIDSFGDNSTIHLKEAFDALKNYKEKILLVITSLEEFTKDERLVNLLQDIVKNFSLPILGITTMTGFRQLEKIPSLASHLQFILFNKNPQGKKRNKSVLIIGASSLFGNAVYNLFKQEYENVRGTGFSKASLLGYDRLDVTSEEEIKKYFSGYCKFDIIVYITGEANADVAEKEKDRARLLNTDAVASISRYVNNCKFVYISSEYVFDGNTGPYGSESKASPINYYGHTKLEGEQVSLKNFSNCLVLRLGALYGYNGPNDKKTTVTSLIAGLHNTEPLKVDNIQIKHPILLEDAAGTLLKLLDYDATGIYQANGPEGLNKQEMAEQIAAVWKKLSGQAFSCPIVGIEQTGLAEKPHNTHMVNVDTPRPFNEGISLLFLKAGYNKSKK